MKKVLTVLGFAFVVGTLAAQTFPADKEKFLLKTFVPWEERNRERLFWVDPRIKIEAEYVKHNAPRWIEISEALKKDNNTHSLKEALEVLNRMYKESLELYNKNHQKKDL